MHSIIILYLIVELSEFYNGLDGVFYENLILFHMLVHFIQG